MRQTTLGAVCDEADGFIQTGPFGSQLHASDYVPRGIPCVMPQDIADNAISEQNIARVTQADAERLGRHRLTAGDIVYSRRGDVERRALIRHGQEGWLCGTGCLRVHFGTRPTVDPAYISYYLGLESSRLWIRQHAIGATMLNLNTKILRSMPVQIPGLSEQRAIAEVLGALDDKIAANERASGLVEDLLRARFEQMGMIDERVDGGVKLSNVIEFQPRRVATGDVPFIDMQAIPTRGWTLPTPSTREAKGGSRFTNGDTLLARITPCLENRKTGYVDDLPEFTVGAGSTELIVMRTRDPHPLPLSFFVATDETFRSYAIQHMVGTSGRQRVSAVDLADFPISMPPPESLQKWGVLADSLFVRVRSMGRENRVLADLREALLPELLSGRLRVKDAEKTVEEVV